VTFAVGNTDGRQREIYSIVKDAHDKALEAIKPGISLKELDGVARGFIAEKGFSDYFGHGLGHGVGLEVHERPVVSPRSEQAAEEGMVFTIEPGIYIPGWGGVRIEDTIVVTRDGWRMLTGVPKDLMIL
jgi:Xaa-Pro aminopeptidase